MQEGSFQSRKTCRSHEYFQSQHERQTVSSQWLCDQASRRTCFFPNDGHGRRRPQSGQILSQSDAKPHPMGLKRPWQLLQAHLGGLNRGKYGRKVEDERGWRRSLSDPYSDREKDAKLLVISEH